MKLILLRHGESIWNKENKFTGWTDVDLSEKGVIEAKEAAQKFKYNNISFDIAFTSTLVRANHTLDIILKELNVNVPIKYSYKLNERHYGALQGLNKDEMKKKYGEEQVHLWRRSADVRPPLLDINDERCPYKDIKYKDIPKDKLPLGECLLDTLLRVEEYYNEEIIKFLKENKNCLVVAHGNSIRSLIMYLENIKKKDIMNIEIATGKAYIYEFDDSLNITNKYYI